MVQPRVPAQGSKASRPLAVKICGVAVAGKTPILTQKESPLEGPRGPGMYTNPPTQESAPEGPNLLVGIRGSDRKWMRAEQVNK